MFEMTKHFRCCWYFSAYSMARMPPQLWLRRHKFSWVRPRACRTSSTSSTNRSVFQSDESVGLSLFQRLTRRPAKALALRESHPSIVAARNVA